MVAGTSQTIPMKSIEGVNQKLYHHSPLFGGVAKFQDRPKIISFLGLVRNCLCDQQHSVGQDKSSYSPATGSRYASDHVLQSDQ